VADGLQANQWARDIQGVLVIDEIGQYLQLWRRIEDATLSTDTDKLIWIWSTSGEYTAKFAYLPSFQGSTRCRAWKLIWKSWAPPQVKFFHYLANIDQC
jgi:hypothetical protein